MSLKYTLEIDCGNAAFSNDGPNSLKMELYDILYDAATRAGEGQTAGILKDINGNPVGSFKLAEESPNAER